MPVKCSPWFSRIRFGREANNTTSEKPLVTESREPMKEDNRGGQDPHRVVGPVKNKKNEKRKKELTIYIPI
jgi:hypothetical protein